MQGLRLAYNYLRIGIMNEFQYRANLYIQILQTFIALGTGLIGLNLVFSQTSDLGGWDKTELLAVMGVFITMGGIIRAAIQPNMERLMEDIRDGLLDFALTKPADAQILISVREFRIWQLAGCGTFANELDDHCLVGAGVFLCIDDGRGDDLLFLADRHLHCILVRACA
jgi:ABC-2 type transport system permease protein